MVVDAGMGSGVIWRYAVGLSTEGGQGMVEGRGQTLWICVAGVEH